MIIPSFIQNLIRYTIAFLYKLFLLYNLIISHTIPFPMYKSALNYLLLLLLFNTSTIERAPFMSFIIKFTFIWENIGILGCIGI